MERMVHESGAEDEMASDPEESEKRAREDATK